MAGKPPARADVDALVRDEAPFADEIASVRISANPALFGPLRDEIRAAALDGLLDAARRFDCSRGVRFRTFARPRIRGAIADWLRTQDHLTRHYRYQVNRVGAEEPWHAPFSLDDAPDVLRTLADPGPGPFDHVARLELLALVERAAGTLPERTRAALALRYAEGWQMKEIAAAMGYTESRACQVMAEAHVRLRAALRTAGGEEAA